MTSMEAYLSFTLPFFIILAISFIFSRSSKKNPPLPPGPTPWPIIGNLPHIGKKLHITLSHLAKQHGQLISLRLGTQLVVVASSPIAATEILKTHDRELSGRHVPHVSFARDPKLNRDSIAWSFDCGEEWMSFRALMKAKLFSSKMVDTQSEIREKKIAEMLDYLGLQIGKTVRIREVVYVYTFNSLGFIYFSRDFLRFDGEESCRVGKLVREMMELWSSGNVSDFYPLLSGLDLQGLRRKADVCVKKMCDLWDGSIKERRESGGFDDIQKDFLDVLIHSGFSDEQISFIFLELLAAVSDGSTSTVEWAMAELIKNPKAMKNVIDELSNVHKTPVNLITETDLIHLPYLHSCVKETLRLHPPAPLLLPRRAREDTQVMNYTIPKNSQVLVNVWAIGRDPSIWKDNPLSFKPERFMNCDIDYKGNDFEYLPFGGGRRICAGLTMATRQVELGLANLMNRFKWSLPNNMDFDDLDMNEKFGVTLLKEQPLLVVPKYKF